MVGVEQMARDLDTVLGELVARLVRDEMIFRQTRHVSVSDAKVRADACVTHSGALAKLVARCREHASAGRTEQAIALLRGDMTEPEPQT
jgi:hypothetical protein